MSDHVHVEGMGQYDGDHPLDVSYFTNRELHLIKTLSGVRAGQIEDAFKEGDNDLVVALAAIALERGGYKVPIDALWDARVGSITLVLEDDEEEADAGPPPSAPPSEPEENESAGGKRLSSGGSSSNGGDPPQNGPKATGGQSSDTSAELALET